jgi:hypothetical protein
MAIAGLAIGYISILLWLILITPILGSRDFKTREHDWHRQNHARASGRPGD